MTTDWVLAEVANNLSARNTRHLVIELFNLIERDAQTTVLAADRDAFAAGFALYRQRPDKDWSLVDCISFNLMRQRGINEAATADRHFEQAGFRALLRG